jgi:Zn-dependent peptidase ImmA (M78 family)
VAPHAPIDSWVYAASLDVIVLEFENLNLPQHHKNHLVLAGAESWSGLTLKEGGKHFVVLNPSHPVSRQANTLVHELSHIQLGHRPGRVDLTASGMMLLSDYPEEFEEEADWLAAAILLPRDALFSRRKRGVSASLIADEFGVSTQLVDWRLRMTGIETQMRRARSL